MPLPLSPNTIRRLRQHGDIDEAEIDHYAQEERRYWERRAREMVVAYSQGGAKTIPTSESEGTKAHHGFFHLRRRHKGKERWHEKEKEPDIEAGPVGESENIKPLPLGGEHGVLGTLLSLYHRQSPSVSSADLTEVSTTPSTPYETDRESILSSDGHLIPKDEQPIRSYFDKNAPKSTGVSSGRSDFVPYRSYRPDRRFSASPSPATCTRKLTAHIPRISPGAHIHIPTPHPSPGIPKATQNAGGVIGALIATTNNLAGPAAPAASTIGPDVSRRGYRLSRYTYIVRLMGSFNYIMHFIQIRVQIRYSITSITPSFCARYPSILAYLGNRNYRRDTTSPASRFTATKATCLDDGGEARCTSPYESGEEDIYV